MCAAVKINRLGKFDLNPRGNLWLKEENRFGHKLLSKMGWRQGKGLGKDENGIAENLKVKMKSGNTGVGWSEKMPLVAESDEYDAVLANLNQKFKSPQNKPKQEEDLKSIELRSQLFKNRLHYGKFVRGKDVCRYSEKDMNSIFVTKKPKFEPPSAPVKSTVTNIESPCSEDKSPETVPIYKSQMSMKEYFEMKMKKKSREIQDNINLTEVENVEELSEKEVVSSRKKGKNNKLKLDSGILEESSSKGNILDSIDLTEAENADESSTEKEVPIKKKSKTKSREKSNILKLDSGISEEPFGEGEMPKYSFNSTETENIEKSSLKKEVSSRKRSKTTKSTEKSKRLKSDPEIVEIFCTNAFTPIESDDVIETSSCKLPQTSFCTIANEDEEPGEVSKKRKRKNALKKAEKLKKVKTEVVDISEESTSPESSEKELQSDLGEFPLSEVQVSDKKRKKLAAKKSKKTKLGKLSKLKSCLKGSANYSLEREARRVSFKEQVFYRVINSDAEDVETEPTNESEISESIASMKDETTEEPPVEAEVNANGTDISDEKIELRNGESSPCSDTLNTDEPCSFEAESDNVPSCMNLPKCDISNYNCWLENQRIATKMKLYQNVIKEIEKHPVLKTSNILDLKGYGNWGF